MVSPNVHSSAPRPPGAPQWTGAPASRLDLLADLPDGDTVGADSTLDRPSALGALRKRLARMLLNPLWVFVLTIAALSPVLARGHGYKVRLLHELHSLIHGPPAPAPAPPPLFPVAEGAPEPGIHFQKVMLPATGGAGFTCLRMGPGHVLYASSDEGRIYRFAINPDGTLRMPEIITSLQRHEASKRLVTGFCFDPKASVEDPIIWITHGDFAFHHAHDFSGRVARMSGPELETVENVIINLPRSAKDHTTNQPAFGPDGALYIPQGSDSAYGAPDAEWENRPEHLLNATLLRLDISKLPPGKPLDVKTPDAGGTYDPFAPGAPLTIYAEGLRNPYSLVWASDGHLYVPVNGSSSGGNTPAGPGVPALTNVPLTEDDWLFRIIPGKYYGHPNPVQGHFVLNGGNPGNRHDSSIIPQYPSGTRPDPDWQPADFDFGPHVSADGIIEYRGGAFGGRLDRSLIVCRFNVGSDLICLTLGDRGKVARVQTGIPGLSHLVNPLSVCEDPGNGNLYVSEYGARRITLARPIEGGSDSMAQADFNDSQSSDESDQVRRGRRLYMMTCIACHGPDGYGVPNLGANLRNSSFVASQNDQSLADFIQAGRLPTDPASILKLTMPPNGGNPTLDAPARLDLAAYLHWLQSASAN